MKSEVAVIKNLDSQTSEVYVNNKMLIEKFRGTIEDLKMILDLLDIRDYDLVIEPDDYDYSISQVDDEYTFVEYH